MNRFSAFQTLLLLLVTVGLVWLWIRVGDLEQESPSELDPEVHVLMREMQTHLHKLSFSVLEENEALTHFYLHELEEVIGDLSDNELTYEGYEISQLTRQMLQPAFSAVDEAADRGEWEQIQGRLNSLVQTCNSCHMATDHGEIVIRGRAEQNPFNQDFSTPSD